jgi:branched-chain amino acid transport system ATP-binding protein
VTATLGVKGVTLNFGGLIALNDVTFELEAGEIFGIIGPNGAGKTTLFDVITGVYRPRSGAVTLEGHDLGHWAPHLRTRAGIARSFQTVGLAPGLSARENILATIEALEDVNAPFPRRSRDAIRRAAADELLEFFQLTMHANAPVTDLPLGITKLLEMAKVFAGSPKVVLLDEPFAGIAPHEGRERVELLVKRRDLTGASVVIVEHHVPLLIETCKRIMVLDYGNIVAIGDPAGVMSSPEVRAAYLGAVVTEVEE